LGYGDLICKYLQNKALWQGTSPLAEKVDRKRNRFPQSAWPQVLVSPEF